MKRTPIAATLAISTLVTTTNAATLTVGPSLIDYDFITITAAISASTDGDTIEITPGLYPENLLISNKDITLRNAGGGAVTVFGQSLDKCLLITGVATNVEIEGITFSNGFSNTAGSGVSVEGGSSAIITDCIIENNNNTFVGAGLYMSGGGTVTNTIIRNNTSSGNGGGVYLAGALQKNFVNCQLRNNTGLEGGGMAYAAAGDVLDMSGCVFTENTSTNRGGAIAVLGNASAGIVEADDCEFINNRAEFAGGAIWISDQDVFRARNSLFIQNSSPTDGGAIRNEQLVEAVNCTFVDNAVDAEGVSDTFSAQRSDAFNRLLNCIVTNESSTSNSGTGQLDASYSLIPEAPSGTADASGNFNANPEFVDPAMGDYTLQPSSPAIDAGNSRGELGNVNVLDIMTDHNGNVRTLDDQETPNTGVSTWEVCIDLGAYEYQPNQAADCPADINADGSLNFLDVSEFLSIFGSGCP
jgi:predicted outer membrane repeat protein